MNEEFQRDRDTLRQRLLELHYDLLPDDEANELRHAIETDSDVANEWARTLRLAGKMADAAKLDCDQLPALPFSTLIQPPSSNGRASIEAATEPHVAPAVATSVVPADSKSDTAQQRRSRWLSISTLVAGLAASIGMLIVGGGYFQRIPVEPMALVRVEAEPIRANVSTGSNQFRMRTTRMDASTVSNQFSAVPATLAFSVRSKNAVLYTGKTTTDESGTGSIQLPDQLVIPRESTLQITAMSDDSNVSSSSVEVPLEPTRGLTYLTLDRPVYRPGETILFRSLTLQRRTLIAGSDVPIRFELLDPSGAIVPGAYVEGVTERGVGNGAFMIPSTAPGGSYTLVAKSLDGFFPEESLEFQVRAYRVPRFKKELEFRQRSYGPGEWVQAEFAAVRAEGGAVANANVRVSASVDDAVIYQANLKTNADGACLVTFALPELIREGSGQLSLSIDDGGTRETETKTIPIQLGRINVDFYPEGGYLVDDLTNRVYFAARDLLGNPIDIAGEIQDRSGQNVAAVATTKDGMGMFEITPRRGETYTLRVTRPVDVQSFPTLPSVVKNLPVIDTGLGVFEPGRPIGLTIRTRKPIRAMVRASCRGEQVGSQEIDLRDGDNTLSLPIRKEAGGVIRVTVLDAKTSRPLVERLVYRRMDRQLTVEITETNSSREESTAELSRSPGDAMRLSLQVRDEMGRGVPAVLGVSVVDDASLSLQDDHLPGLRTHFLLTSEIEKPEDLEQADFYLAEGEAAAKSLDLLLGTQGWRRFAYETDTQMEMGFREQLVRLLELDGSPDDLADQRVESGGAYRQRIKQYQASLHSAWEQLIDEARMLLLAVVFIWMVGVMIHLRRNARPSAAHLLILASSIAIAGCGASYLESTAAPELEATTDESVASRSMGDVPSGPTVMMNESPGSARVESEETSESSELLADAGAPGPDRTPGPDRSPDQTAPPNAIRLDEVFTTDDRGHVFRMDGTAPRLIGAEELRQLLESRGLDAESLADELLKELRFPIRQYAHQYRSNSEDDRSDFTETLYWQPLLITDSEGRATIRFDLSDSVSAFRVRVDGHTSDGRIGSGSDEVVSRLPFQIEPKLPLEVTSGDVIDLPIAVVNATKQAIKVDLNVTADPELKLTENAIATGLSVPADRRGRHHTQIRVSDDAGRRQAKVRVRGSSSTQHSDGIERTLQIVPSGFPSQRSVSGRLDERAKIVLPVPDQMVPKSLAVTVRAFPSPVADVMTGVESILREPSGCFEQTSATNYPNTMVLQYLAESQTANPSASRKARGMLDRGYAKLLQFECDLRGYEWFGDDPGHEALSAFGLMQFTDMAKVMEVSDEMLQRTRAWLTGRRDGQGGFHRNPRHLHVWSVQQPIVNAYVLWALSEADVASGNARRSSNELGPELNRLAEVAQQSDDPYLIALSAATLINVQRLDEGQALLQRLKKFQDADGSLTGKTTVTSSGGISLKMETTALATLAWVKDPESFNEARLAAKWIQSNRVSGGGFGSTQATVLALKALVATAKISQASAGERLQVLLNGDVIGEATLPSEPQSGSTVEITGLADAIEKELLESESIELELVSNGSRNLSYSVDLTSHVTVPDSHQDCPLEIQTQWIESSRSEATTSDGSLLQVSTVLRNVASSGQPMAVAIVGLPGGVEPRPEQLDELKERGDFDFYEIRGRDVVFYWRTLEPGVEKRVNFHVTATVPGTYAGPASRAYLYYTAEQKHWTQPLKVTIAQSPGQ